MKETMNYDLNDKKEKEDMFKSQNFKIFWWNPNDSNFDPFRFLGEINLYILKLREKEAENKVVNKVINKITDDFEKNSCSGKIKRIKTICQKHFTKLQKMKNTKSKIKPIEIGKNLEQRIDLGVKIIRRILGHKKLKWQIKYSEKNLTVLFIDLINQDF